MGRNEQITLPNTSQLRVHESFLLLQKKFQGELRELVEKLLNRWGVRMGHTATCVMILGVWFRHSPEDILSLGRADTNGLLFKLVPPQ